MKKHLIFLKNRTFYRTPYCTVQWVLTVRDFSTLNLHCIVITFSAPTRRHSTTISAVAELPTIDSWSRLPHLPGTKIAGCFEPPKPITWESPKSEIETIFLILRFLSPNRLRSPPPKWFWLDETRWDFLWNFWSGRWDWWHFADYVMTLDGQFQETNLSCVAVNKLI